MMQGTLFGILAAAVWTWIAGSGGLNIALAVTTFHLLIINTVHIIQHRGEMHHTPLWVMIILAGAASASTWTLTQNYGGEIKEKLQENFGRVLPAWDTTAQPNPNPNPNHNPQTVRVTEPDVATHPKNDAKTDTKGDDNTHAIKPHRTLWETLQMSIPALKKTPFHRVNPHEEIQITRRDEPGVIRVRRKTYFQKIGLDLPPGRYKTEKGGYIYILP
jgi:hypothetical protein